MSICRRKTGKAKITPAYNLPSEYVIHTVGPIIYGNVTQKDKSLLASCYRSCLELAEENDVGSIAFCCISTGEFHYPNNLAAEVAVHTVRDYKAKTGSKMERLKIELETADAIVISAGSGLSTAAGYTCGKRFETYFSDFADRYGIRDMYSGGFYPFPDRETYWAWWARHIYVNRYDQPESTVYQNLLALVKDRNYFVFTTNVNHQFQLAGFDKKRLFYTQGYYGLWQCSDPCHQVTYNNEEWVKEMLAVTGFLVEKDGKYEIDFANRANWKMEIPTELISYCPDCKEPMTMNLRGDDTFVQDERWYAANSRYEDFLRRHKWGSICTNCKFTSCLQFHFY